jgi:hypothetical protein
MVSFCGAGQAAPRARRWHAESLRAEAEWIRAVDRAQLGPWIASFRPERWSEVRAALLDVLGFDADRDDDEG